MNTYTIPFEQICLDDLPKVGGKNASLGEMFNKLKPLGIKVPDGFAITATAYRNFLSSNRIKETLRELLDNIDPATLSNLPGVAKKCRDLVLKSVLPDDLKEAITQSYKTLNASKNEPLSVAVRSSATAEDLPTASFAG